MTIPLSTRFGPRDRIGALQFAFRHAAADGQTWVLLFDYNKNDWMACPIGEFVEAKTLLWCESDVRYITPKGAVS